MSDSTTIKPEKPTHWYNPDSTPAYGATMREARKEGLYPSVTTVMNVVDRPPINTWKVNTSISVSFDVFYWNYKEFSNLDEKTKEKFLKMVKEEYEKRMAAARDLGTKHHSALEAMLNNEPFEDPEVNPKTIDAARAWLKENDVLIHGVETCFASPLLYGGRVDLWGKWRGGRDFVLDWKTTDTRGKIKETKAATERVLFYPEHAIQLAACAYGLEIRESDLVSVVVSTTEEGVIVPKVWVDAIGNWSSNGYWFERFLNRFEVWKDENNYRDREDRA